MCVYYVENVSTALTYIALNTLEILTPCVDSVNICHGVPDLPVRGCHSGDHSSTRWPYPFPCSGRQPYVA